MALTHMPQAFDKLIFIFQGFIQFVFGVDCCSHALNLFFTFKLQNFPNANPRPHFTISKLFPCKRSYHS